MSPIRILALISTLFFLQACDNDSNTPAPEVYSAEIVWTEYGIPHITAEDWGSLGYGFGYAYGQENFCVLMKEYLFANGESARWLGDEGDLDSDFVFKLYNSDEAIDRMLASLSDRTLELGEGYVAGLNRYLADTGVDGLASGEEGCRGAEWAFEIDLRGMIAVWHKRILLGSAEVLKPLIAAAEPPEMVVKNTPMSDVELKQMVAQLLKADGNWDNLLPEPERIGSNAYAIGGDTTATGTGILFGNPHFPWQGPNRFFMSHLKIPGVYDIQGAALHGVPLIMVGFNQDLAWSHTVSTGQRFTLYELTLSPTNPLQYEYDGEMQDMDPVVVSAETVNEAGEVVTEEHTFYMTRYGPMLDLGGFNALVGGWPTIAGTAFTYRDANLENMRIFDQFLSMGQASNIEELDEAMQAMGIPWVNTIAADRYGDAYYADVSVVPHVTQAKVDTCVRGPLAPLITALSGLITLDASDSACEWGSDEGAPEGILGYENMPVYFTREYGANANDSYWLTNPREFLEGFSPIIGNERIEQTIRTRLTFVQAEERLAGTDGLGPAGFSKDNVKQISYSARNHAAELVLEDLLALCAPGGNGAAVDEACSILGSWDTRHTIDSTGGHIFYEFWKIARKINTLWLVPFNPADPVNTPNTLNPAAGAETLQALADGVQNLHDAGIALDQPWGDVQFVDKNGVRIPIHGASGSMAFSVITSSLIDGEGYSRITHGNSYMQTVTWDESDCPDADGMLTYSQSTDPESDHYADATELYSQGDWIDMAYCQADIDAAEIGRQTLTGLRE